MPVECIKPAQYPKVDTPQCCWKVADFTDGGGKSWANSYIDQRARDATAKGFLAEACQHQSSYIIDGEHYCRRHAGAKALAILLKAGVRDENS